MIRSCYGCLVGAMILTASSLAFGADFAEEGQQLGPVLPDLDAIQAHKRAALERQTAEAGFKQTYPGVGLYKQGEAITRLWGQPFSFGASPTDAADAFRQTHGRMFGVDPANLQPGSLMHDGRHIQPVMYRPESDDYKFTLVCYRQYQDDIPVFQADLRLLVRNEPGSPLVLASSGLRDLKGFSVGAGLRVSVGQAAFIKNQFAVARRETLAAHPTLINFTRPETVIWAGVDDQVVEPRVAIEFIGDNFAPGGVNDGKWRFITDINTGEILYEESILYRVDGNASGNATVGIGADICETESPMALPHLAITSGGNSTFTSAAGDFTIAAGGGTVDATLADGLYFNIFDWVTTVESLSLSATTPANFSFNAANSSEFIRAQVNGYLSANVVRSFTEQFNPSYPTFTDTDIPCWVNRTDGFCPGNAWYDPADGGSPTGYSINFCQSGGSNPNTAWSSVIYHEFGHHLVQAAGSGQGEYGEGTGDCMSAIILDDPRLGLGFFGTCDAAGTLRSADNTMQYPCSGEIHFCGQLIAACIWDTRNQLVLTEPVNYTSILGDLEVNSILLHTGSLITPQITIDWLTLDDDDANLNNGTPHYAEICAGFGAHSMDCPPLAVGMGVSPTSTFNASGDIGGPFSPASQVFTIQNMGPTASINYSVTTAASWLTITNGSGTLPSVGSTALVTVEFNANANVLPQGVHNATVTFTNVTDGVGNTLRSVNLSVGIPDNCASAMPVCIGSVSDSTAGMTNDGSASCGSSDASADLWYSYTPNASGTATFSLCTGTSYDSVLSVHSACPGTSGNELGCNDDACSPGGPSEVTIGVTGGTEYLIRVTGWSGASGSFTLTITGPDCSPVLLDITYPNGLPAAMAPGVATSFQVRIQNGDEIYQPGTATLHYRYGGGIFQTAALSPLGGDLFQATLPAALCTDVPEFYISAQGDLGSTVASPLDAPVSLFGTVVGTLIAVMDDNFETDQGWVAVNLGATTGDWQRGVPVNDPGWANDPASDSDGSGQCYLTQNVVGNTDVDNGQVQLTSPAIDMSAGNITISYDYFLKLTNTDGIDRLLVQISSNGDAGPWTEIARHDTDGGLSWRSHTITQTDLDAAGVTLTANMKLRFNTNDEGTQSINESGLDAFQVSSFACDAAPCPGADGDLNLDGLTDGGDLQRFVSGIISGATPDEVCHGDFDGLNGLDIGDIAGMVNALLTAP